MLYLFTFVLFIFALNFDIHWSGYGLFVGIKVEMKVSTTGYPPLFYKDEQLIIECKATEYSALAFLQIRDRVKNDQHGCSYGGGNHIPDNALLRPAFPDLTEEICESSLRPTTPPSTLSVTGKVTDDLIGLQLYCYAAEFSGTNENGNLTIDTIRGRLF